MRKNNTKNHDATPENQGYATFAIQGVVQSVFEGKNADYARVRVYKGGYYTDYNVAVNKEIGIEEGDKVTCEGAIDVYQNNGKYNTAYTANSVEETDTLFPEK